MRRESGGGRCQSWGRKIFTLIDRTTCERLNIRYPLPEDSVRKPRAGGRARMNGLATCHGGRGGAPPSARQAGEVEYELLRVDWEDDGRE